MKFHDARTSLRSLLTLLAIGGMVPSGLATEPVVQADLPERMSLNGQWAFQLAPDAEAAEAYRDFYRPDYDASRFSPIKVPAHWSLEGFEDPRYVNGSEAEGFYLRRFTVPEAAADLRALLTFDGVWVSAEVWVNGINVGRHDSGFTQFSFDISDELIAGGENLMAVRVRQQIPASLFKFDANDDWGLAGIYRDVSLSFAPDHLRIDHVEVETDLDAAFRDADLRLRVFVARHERDHYIAPSPPFQIRATLMDLDGQVVQALTETITVAGAHNGRDVHLRMAVRSPRLWTAETPALYCLQIELVRNGQVVHQWADQIGFREISTEGGVLRINGQLVKLRGVASHDLHPDVGRATTEAHWRKDIALMKEANINAVRLAHYPHAEGFVRLCDELGLYVLNEIPLGFGGDRMANPIFASGMLLRIHETIQRDRNRPSVIVWDFGNEDGLTYLHTVGLRAIKGLDPTRPVLLPFRAEPELPPEVDILAPHYWSAADYDQLGASARRPVITTEYTHALGDDGLGELDSRWDALTRHASGAGAMIWLWADQGIMRPIEGRPVFDPMEDKAHYTREGGELVRHSVAGPDAIFDAHGNYGTDGIVTPDRRPTRDYLEAKAVYAPVRILVERVVLGPTEEALSLPVYNGFDFTPLSAVTFEWHWYRDGRSLGNGARQVEAPPRTRTELAIPVAEWPASGDHYLELTIRRADGSVMAVESVRLEAAPLPALATDSRTLEIKVRETREAATVSAGEAVFRFDKQSGALAGIAYGKAEMGGPAGLVVWRPSTFNERNRYDRRENQHDWNAFMQGVEGEARSWSMDRQSGRVEIETTVHYREDDLNTVVVEYRYTVLGSGELEIAMVVRPKMDIPELPEIGLVLPLPARLETLTWLGEGPYDALPGKSAATRFGYWEESPDSPLATGTKTGLDWARLRFSGAGQLQIRGAEGVRLEENGDSRALRILTHVGGAWTKNGPPERPEWHLNLEEGKAFHGLFRLRPGPVEKDRQ